MVKHCWYHDKETKMGNVKKEEDEMTKNRKDNNT